MERDEPSISPELAEGEILENYAIEALIGRTDACLEYRARDHASGAQVRIKEYYPAQIAIRVGRTVMAAKDSLAGEFDYGLHRFVQMGQACSRLTHDNLLRFVRVLEGHGTAYQIIEMPDGVPFEEWLAEIGGKADQDTVDSVARQLCDAIGYLHAAENLHLNVCPGTIFVDPQGLRVTLTEHFAAVRGFSTREANYWHGYLPPESVSDQRRRLETAASDIYSVGAILLRAATGEPPPSVPARATADTVPASLGALEGTFRPSFVRALGQALALPANERPASIREWRSALVPPTARRSHGPTRVKVLDAPTVPAQIAERPVQRTGAPALAAGSALLFTLCGLAMVSEIRNPTRAQSAARDIIALRSDRPPPAEPKQAPAPVAMKTPKADRIIPAPAPAPAPTPPPERKEVQPPPARPLPPISTRPIPYPPPGPEIAPQVPAPPVAVTPPPVAEPKPEPEQPPKIALPEPLLPEPKIALPLPIPLPSILRRTTIGPEDTAVRVPSLGKPTGEGALGGPWLALASRSGASTIQLYKLENGGFTGTPPPATYTPPGTPPGQVARLALDTRNGSEILVAAPDGTLSALDRASGRWQGLPPEPNVTKRVLSITYDASRETFAIVSVIRKAAAPTYSTIAERFSAKRKGVTRTLIPDGSLVLAAAISAKRYALAVRGQGILVIDGDSERRLLDHRSREVLNVLEFSPSGTYLAAGGEPAHIHLWEQDTDNFGEPKKLAIPDDGEQTGRDPPFLRAIAFSADQNLMAAGLSSGTILVWNVRYPKDAVLTYRPASPADVLTWLTFIKSGEGRHLLLFPTIDGAVRSFAVDADTKP